MALAVRGLSWFIPTLRTHAPRSMGFRPRPPRRREVHQTPRCRVQPPAARPPEETVHLCWRVTQRCVIIDPGSHHGQRRRKKEKFGGRRGLRADASHPPVGPHGEIDKGKAVESLFPMTDTNRAICFCRGEGQIVCSPKPSVRPSPFMKKEPLSTGRSPSRRCSLSRRRTAVRFGLACAPRGHKKYPQGPAAQLAPRRSAPFAPQPRASNSPEHQRL